MENNKIIKDNGNIYCINDPNNVNVNYDGEQYQLNGMPPYEDMFVFAELTAVRKSRTILVRTEASNYGFESNGMDNTIKINFLGNNQNKGTSDNPNPDYLKFTTNYYDGSTGNDINYESFGIQSIKVTINSSFIPQVNIQFVDIRGLSFFNQKDSPYRILFDFPPPIFNLTIKGYYGKALTYRLHLVKYTTEFKSENGNFIIDAQFVAMTYAPLTDVLFRYIINFPLMNKDSDSDPSTIEPPKNTNDLITKLKNLYSAISKELKTDNDTVEYDNNLKSLSRNREITSYLSRYVQEIGIGDGQPFLMTKTNNLSQILIVKDSKKEPTDTNTYNAWLTQQEPSTSKSTNTTIKKLNNLSDYDAYLKKLSTNGIPTQVDNRLIIGIITTTYNDGENPILVENKKNILYNKLNAFAKNLIKKAKDIGTTGQFSNITIKDPTYFNNNYNVQTNEYNPNKIVEYIYIDITDFYLKLYRDEKTIIDTLTNLTKVINVKINNMVLEKLGMRPTIYNIFKIILDDVDTFFDIIRNTSKNAENHHNKQDIKNLILNSDNYADNNKKIYSFPLIIDRTKVCGGIKEEKIAPIKLSESLPEPFPEITLVNDFINTFLSQKRKEVLANMKSEQDGEGNLKWIPISPIDSILASYNVESPYYGLDTSDGGSEFQPIYTYEDKKLNYILKILLKRFYVLSQNTYPISFYDKNQDITNAYIKLYASSEAINLASSIIQTDYSDNLKQVATIWGNDVNGFFDYVKKYLPDFYDFSEEERKYYKIANDLDAYVDKNNNNYVGLTIYDDDIIERTPNDGSDNPIDIFQNSLRKGWFKSFLFGRYPETFYNFTKENVLFIKDVFIKRDGTEKHTKTYGNVRTKTRFLSNSNIIQEKNNFYILLGDSAGDTKYFNNDEKENVINEFLNKGNDKFKEYGAYPSIDSSKLNIFNDVVSRWSNELAKIDDIIYDDVINSNSKLSALIYWIMNHVGEQNRCTIVLILYLISCEMD